MDILMVNSYHCIHVCPLSTYNAYLAMMYPYNYFYLCNHNYNKRESGTTQTVRSNKWTITEVHKLLDNIPNNASTMMYVQLVLLQLFCIKCVRMAQNLLLLLSQINKCPDIFSCVQQCYDQKCDYLSKCDYISTWLPQDEWNWSKYICLFPLGQDPDTHIYFVLDLKARARV
jgi:hypothetical protein